MPGLARVFLLFGEKGKGLGPGIGKVAVRS